MKIPAVKKLVEHYSLDELNQAEESILNEESPKIEIGGDDEGEMLTHVSAAQWILKEMAKGEDFKSSLRNYTHKVRNSIS